MEQQLNVEENNDKKQTFIEAVSKMKQTLINDNLYREGCIYITYDRDDHSYHVCESFGDGISADEHPNFREYCQIRMLEISIEALDEEYSSFKYENEVDDITTEQREEIIGFTIDNAIENMEMEADKKAALFELDLIESGRYVSELRDYVNKHNESLGNINYHLKELGIIREIRMNILDEVKNNAEVFTQ